MNTLIDSVLQDISRQYGPNLKLVRLESKQFLVGKTYWCPVASFPETVTGYVADFFAEELKEIRVALTQVPEIVFEQEIDGRTKVLSHLAVFSKEERRNIVRLLQDLKPFFRKLEGVCDILEHYNGKNYQRSEQYFSSWTELVESVQKRVLIKSADGGYHKCLHTQRLLIILDKVRRSNRENLRLSPMHN